ncbi:hypothetical protein FJD34_12310 [Pseudomonas brenneri]|uniref:Uncharacterized protein n=1 Tax=Pseudomonas brenneri TaxID=129817 RepID=A0A5B2UL92_9PSED|nr:hypothetical protein [Pseudomonas brenneri]KAA2227212.1 hypothetical protein F1720_23470 [Pseudomonas brenneri]TWR78629.1 hypothetical protein FJD34_12310 [Pseudomonas brenneri]
MLAKNANENAGYLDKRVVLEFLASKLAPTVKPCYSLTTSDRQGSGRRRMDRPHPALGLQ